jgi:two-component system, chemotaxis family, protein-glutamate methylesterase/glutaminase
MNILPKDFPVVCVGGSAGASSAYSQLLKHLRPDLGVAIVIVNHITRTSATLHKILPRFTKMPVTLITEGLPLQPNHLFIIPANRELHVLNGEFRLTPISKPKGWPDVVTLFLCSLAQNWGGKLVAVIFSGLDSDGAEALKTIKEVGGITIAQMPATAEWSDMPESAIKTGHIDFILSTEDIAQKIVEIAHAFPGQEWGRRTGEDE